MRGLDPRIHEAFPRCKSYGSARWWSSWIAGSSPAMTLCGWRGRAEQVPIKLVRHQHRQFGVGQDVARGAAEDHLPQPALGEGALHQEVAALRLGGAEDGVAGALALEPDRHRL